MTRLTYNGWTNHASPTTSSIQDKCEAEGVGYYYGFRGNYDVTATRNNCFYTTNQSEAVQVIYNIAELNSNSYWMDPDGYYDCIVAEANSLLGEFFSDEEHVWLTAQIEGIAHGEVNIMRDNIRHLDDDYLIEQARELASETDRTLREALRVIFSI